MSEENQTDESLEREAYEQSNNSDKCQIHLTTLWHHSRLGWVCDWCDAERMIAEQEG